MASVNEAAGNAPVSSNGHPGTELDDSTVRDLQRQFELRPANRLMQNAVTQTTVDNIALNRGVVTNTDHSFAHMLDDWSVTNQKKSGRCWMFAGLNLLRVATMKQMNLKEFEFSQNFAFFWDKLERANYFLEAIIDTADRDVDDRTVAWLLQFPLEDGGQWNMFVNVIEKHGLVPKAVMPETESSSNSHLMNAILLEQLRQGAREIRELRARGADLDRLRACKHAILQVVYRVLSIHLGSPPSEFDWQWNDKDREFHRDGVMTPRRFGEKYITAQLTDYVCLVNDPRTTSPYGRTFTVEYLGNVVGGSIVKYLNVPIEVMKDAARRTIEDGEPVWMGCDVGKQMRRDLGIWDAGLFDYGGVYGADFNLDKAGRLLYHQTQMTHAMLFTGVDSQNGTARRWRVENSWGDENGRKGFYVMNDSWFDEYMFEIAVRKNYLTKELQQAAQLEPIVLPAWDPMGALAGRGGPAPPLPSAR